jgi:hypothetical protein
MRVYIGSVIPSQWRKYKIGQLFSPPKTGIAPKNFVLDNGAFSNWVKNREFCETDYLRWLDRWLEKATPDWLVVPDAVGNKAETLALWRKWEGILREFKVPLAIAVQDGMEIKDIPATADVIFVGGTTLWKIKNIPYWCKAHPRVHIARVNGWHRLYLAYASGAKSVDGTGFLRKTINGQPAVELELFLRWQAGELRKNSFEFWALNPSDRRYLLSSLKPTNYKDLPLFCTGE